ncbi:MAG TPA: VOC family protein [Sinorhizobium sp.]|uniref:Extradiol dioxygenase n=1 Tax=Sinorhizobium alkalisoli TaxID=1752398 RepID=A0A1E3V8W3_9HYPH|nr:VOC family protein [Sinorhizobium alkalisoli]MCG5479042.1 VOC family protein [Sinorhizobium alkalisoli]ODR89969.1 extradiol dioxygenase [Sinorhizobium alkalisoli]QFI64905.1 Glyoxalase family protein [Sinorhizobium alkalisoli]HXV29673.1 VOC family protein [Sinorhizobium sp.]
MRQTIARVAILVPDYDVAIAFYCGRLGFDLIKDSDLGGGKRWVLVRPRGASETALLIARAEGDRQTAAIGNQTGGRVGFFLFTDDFAREHAAMLAAGVEFLETPRHEAYGTVAVFTDPFGNRWDLLQPAS